MVPVADLTRRAARLSGSFAESVQRVLASGRFLFGAELHALEADLEAWSGYRHAVGVSSGASALQLALTAVGVGPGDEVLVPAFTAVPTASAVWATGAVPVPVDVDPDSAVVDPDSWEAARTPRTRALIVVHLYGRPAVVPITDLPVIEDAAQAHGALTNDGRSVAVAYSFYPTKNLGGIGDGGCVMTDDDDVAERLQRLRVHGMEQLYVHTERSQNFRLSELEAAWLRLALPLLADDNDRRRAIARRYRAAAPLRWQSDHPRHVHHLAVLHTSQRTQVRAVLGEHGVGSAVHYPLALTQQPAYRQLTRTPCPVSEEWAASCVTVPCFPEMTDDEVECVVQALAAVAERSACEGPADG